MQTEVTDFLNNFAISSVGIGEALRRSASALAAAGNTIDDSIALVTAANSVIQDPDVVGTMLKTLSMYLRASKTEAEEAGIETDGMADSVSKLRSEIKSLTGVDIMLDEDTFKSTIQIIREISQVWGELSDVSQANVLERLAGKRQGNVLASLITNFDVAEEALETSLDSAGSAAKENEKVLESIEGHIQRLTIAFEELSTTVLNSDFIKTTIDFLTNLVGLLNDATKILNMLPGNGSYGLAALAGVAVEAFSSDGTGGIGKSIVETLIKKRETNNELEKVLKDLPDEIAKSKNLSEAIGNASKYYDRKYQINDDSTKEEREARDTAIANHEYETKLANKSSLIHQKAAAQSFTGFLNINKKVLDSINLDAAALKAFAGDLKGIEDGAERAKKLNAALNGVVSPLNNASQAAKEWAVNLIEVGNDTKVTDAMIANFTARQKENAKAATLGTKAWGTFKNALVSIGGALTSVGISMLINAAISGITWLIQHKEEEVRAARESAEAFKEEQDAIEDYSAKITELRKELDNENTTSERAVAIRRELYEIQNDLIDNYDIESGKINLVTGNLEEQLKVLREINKEKYLEAYELNPEGYRTAVENIQNQQVVLDVRSGWNVRQLPGSNFVDYDVEESLREIYESSGFKINETLNNWTFDGDIYSIDKALEEVQTKIKSKIDSNDLEDALEKLYQGVYDYLADVRREWSTKIISESEEVYSQWLQNESEYSDEYWDLIRKQSAIKFAEESGNEEEIAEAKKSFNEALAQIIESANTAGDTDVVHFLNKEFAETIEKASELPIETNIDLHPTVTVDVATLETKLSEAKEKIEASLQNADLFDKAIESIAKGETIGFDSVQALIEIDGSLAEAFTKTAGGYIISVDKLTEARGRYVQATEESLEATRAESEELKKTTEANIEYWAARSKNLEEASKYDSQARKLKSESDAKLKEETDNLDSINNLIALLSLLFGELGNTSGGGDTTDLNKEEFEKEYARRNYLRETDQQSDEDYYEWLSWAIDHYFSDTTKYLEENRKYKEEVYNWEKQQEENRHNKVISDLEEEAEALLNKKDYEGAISKYDSAIAENNKKINAYKSLPNGSEIFKDEIEELKDKNKDFTKKRDEASVAQFTFNADEWKDELDRGVISWQKYSDEITKIFNDAGDKLDNDWLEKYLDPDTEYDTRLKEWENAHKGWEDDADLLAEHAKFQRKLGISVYGQENENKDLNKLREALDKANESVKESAELQLEALKERLTKGEISWQEYLDTIKKIRDSAVDENGNSVVDAELENSYITDGEEIIGEQTKNWFEERKAETEKFYQDQIDALDKINSKEEERNRLTKARLDLEKAQQKNQLVFKDGKWEYMENQDAVISALDEKKSAEIEAKKSEFTEEKEEALKPWNDAIEALEKMSDETIAKLDPQYLEKLLQYGSENGLLTPEEYDRIVKATNDAKASEENTSSQSSSKIDEKDETDATNQENKENNEPKETKSIWDFLGIIGIASDIASGKVSLLDALTNYVTSAQSSGDLKMLPSISQETKDAAQSAISNVYNNSTITNDNSVSIGTITVTTSGNTSQEMVIDFCNQLAGAIQEKAQKVI